MRAQQPVGKVAAHRLLDALDARRRIASAQEGFREDQLQGRGRVADLARHPLPVVGLGGVLVAGDHGPLRQVDAGPGQEHVRQPETGGLVHEGPCSKKGRSW